MSKKREESSLFKRPQPKLGHAPNGYILSFFDSEEIWITDEQAGKIIPMLEEYQFINLNGGIYKISNIKKIVPHERKLTDEELQRNALLSTKEQNDKFRSLQRES